MSVDPVAELALGLDVDLPVAAEVVEVVDVERAEVDLQRLVDVVQRDAQRRDLGPVDVHVELRRVGAEQGGHADQRRLLARSLPTRSSVCCCRAARPEAAAVLDHELEAAGHARGPGPAARRRRSPGRP